MPPRKPKRPKPSTVIEAMSRDEFAVLLRSRPDVVLPIPGSLAALVRRLNEVGSLEKAIGGLNRLDRAILRSASQVTAEVDWSPRARLDAQFPHLPPAAIDNALTRLKGQLLVTGEDELWVPGHVSFYFSRQAAEPVHVEDVNPMIGLTKVDQDATDKAGTQALAKALRSLSALTRVIGEDPPLPLRGHRGLPVETSAKLAAKVGLDDAPFNLLAELSGALHLVDTAPSNRIVPTSAVDSWPNRPIAQRWRLLVETWFNLPCAPWAMDSGQRPLSMHLVEEQAVRERFLVLSLLDQLPIGRRPSHSDTVQFFHWHRPAQSVDYAHATVEGTLAEATVLGLVAQGVLTTAGRAMVDSTVDLHDPENSIEGMLGLPEPIDYFAINDDLSITAPGPLLPHVALELELGADLISHDGVGLRYQLTDDSVGRAMSHGRLAEDLLMFYGIYSRTGVPASVAFLVEDVGRRWGQLTVSSAVSVITALDEPVLKEVLSRPLAKTLGLRQIAPTVAISQQSLEYTLRLLKADGYLPRVQEGLVSIDKPSSATSVLAKITPYNLPSEISDYIAELLYAIHHQDLPMDGKYNFDRFDGHSLNHMMRPLLDTLVMSMVKRKAVTFTLHPDTGRDTPLYGVPIHIKIGSVRVQDILTSEIIDMDMDAIRWAEIH